MELEPGVLLGGELGGGLAEVADGFEGELAGDGVGLVLGRGLEFGGPAVDGGEDFGQGLAQVGMAGAVVVGLSESSSTMEVNCSMRSRVSVSRPGWRVLE